MRRVLVPAFTLLAAAVLERWGPDWSLAQRLLASRLVFSLVFLLAWRFRRGRTAAAVLVVATVSEALGIGPDPTQRVALIIVAALDLALLAVFEEWPVFSRAGALRVGALALQAPLIAWLPHLLSQADANALLQPLVSGLPHTDIPHSGWLSLLIAAAALMVAFARKPSPLPGTLLATLVCLAIAAEHAIQTPWIATHFLTAGGVILGLGVVENAFSLAFEDVLTGLPGRRALEETLAHLSGTYSIALVDLDHFKRVNDRHGHDIGDQVLRMVAAQLRRVGGGGRAFRYGGEEFAVVFAGRSLAEARPHLEDLRQRVSEQPFVVRAPDRPAKKPRTGRGFESRSGSRAAAPRLRATLSVGVAERSERRASASEVLEAADRALYRSKRAGRNRISVAR